MKVLAILTLAVISATPAFAQEKTSVSPPLIKAFVSTVRSQACNMLPEITATTPDQSFNYSFRGNGIYWDNVYALSAVIGLQVGTLTAATTWGLDKTIVLNFAGAGSVFYGHPTWKITPRVSAANYQKNTVSCAADPARCLDRLKTLDDMLYQARYKLLSHPDDAANNIRQIECMEALARAFRNEIEKPKGR